MNTKRKSAGFAEPSASREIYPYLKKQCNSQPTINRVGKIKLGVAMSDSKGGIGCGGCLVLTLLFIIVAIKDCERGCKGSTNVSQTAVTYETSSVWAFKRSEIPYGEYGGCVKYFSRNAGAKVRNGAGIYYTEIGYVPSGYWVRIKDFNDIEWGSIGNGEDWWLKIYSKDDETGYIVYSFIDEHFKQE